MGGHQLVFEIRRIEDYAFLEAFVILKRSQLTTISNKRSYISEI